MRRAKRTGLGLMAALLMTTGQPGWVYAAADWGVAAVPKVWEKGAVSGGGGGYAWYRCEVEVPLEWQGRDLELFLEPVDDAREVFWNGEPVARIGAMPPAYRSGLGGKDRHDVPGRRTRFGARNHLAVRVYQDASRHGFSVGAPVLFGGAEAISLKGEWAVREGDGPGWAVENLVLPDRSVFSSRIGRADAESALKKLETGEGPLTPRETVSRLKCPEDLELELVLSEPAIGQPLSMKFDERGRLWLVEYLQYPDPAGLRMVSRDMHLRTVYDRVPAPPPHHTPGRDRVTIHEDTNGDGVFDAHRTFIEGLSLVTSVALGRGGVWVLNPPYLLFYPDGDADDVPDGDPEVVLEGFGIEDSHSVANSLRWGPDGWLYGAQGSTVSGRVRRPGSAEEPVRTLGQLIWRYHPERRRYEVFAEGGGNTFGVEIDAEGRLFSGHNGGNTRGFHYVQGGYYQKGFGKHGELSNPHAFGYFSAMAHHDVPRFSHTFLIYEGVGLPERYAGKLFAVEPLQGRVMCSEISPDRSSFRTKDIEPVLRSTDPWVRPVDIQAGPDGAVYVADFYEQRIDHASHYQGRIHRGSGRIYRLRSREGARGEGVRMAGLTDSELVNQLSGTDKWHRQTAQRLLAERRAAGMAGRLRSLLRDEAGQAALEALWGLSRVGELTEADLLGALSHSNPSVRAWAVRLACDDGAAGDRLGERMAELARYEAEVAVRSQLAGSARRLGVAEAWPVLRGLLEHDEDAEDLHVPLLVWWAVESKVATHREAVLELVTEGGARHSALYVRHLAGRLMRRLALGGARADWAACARLLRSAGEEERPVLQGGLEAAFAGRTWSGLPPELAVVLTGGEGASLLMRARRGEVDALREALRLVSDERASAVERLPLIAMLGESAVPGASQVLLEVVRRSRDDSARGAALGALGAYGEGEIARVLVELHGQLPQELRGVAQVLMAGREAWALTFLEAVDEGKVDAETVSPAVVRKLLLHDSERIRRVVARHWRVRERLSDAERTAAFARVRGAALSGSGNPYRGRARYETLCGGCHRLLGRGGAVGPDLTSYQRWDLDRLLMNVIDPSAEIREGYENYVLTLRDGRTVNGFLVESDSAVVVVRGVDGRNETVSRDLIESMEAASISLMPEGLMEVLSEQEIRDLLAYVRSSQPLPE